MKYPKSYIGVDPGRKGSICCLVPDSQHQIGFMPTDSKPADIYAWLKRIQSRTTIQIIMIEDVHAIFGTSAGSNFTFGWNSGGINWLCECIGCGVDRVKPRKWQSHAGLTVPKSHKGAIRKRYIKTQIGEIAERLYPQADVRGPKGGLLDGKSDSLLIAHYARHLYN